MPSVLASFDLLHRKREDSEYLLTMESPRLLVFVALVCLAGVTSVVNGEASAQLSSFQRDGSARLLSLDFQHPAKRSYKAKNRRAKRQIHPARSSTQGTAFTHPSQLLDARMAHPGVQTPLLASQSLSEPAHKQVMIDYRQQWKDEGLRSRAGMKFWDGMAKVKETGRSAKNFVKRKGGALYERVGGWKDERRGSVGQPEARDFASIAGRAGARKRPDSVRSSRRKTTHDSFKPKPTRRNGVRRNYKWWRQPTRGTPSAASLVSPQGPPRPAAGPPPPRPPPPPSAGAPPSLSNRNYRNQEQTNQRYQSLEKQLRKQKRRLRHDPTNRYSSPRDSLKERMRQRWRSLKRPRFGGHFRNLKLPSFRRRWG